MEAVPEDKEAQDVELEREAGNRRRGRHILVAVNHGPNSKHAFDWAIAHLCRLADTLHLISVIHKGQGSEELCVTSKTSEEEGVVYEATQGLLDNLAREAYEVAMVRTETNIIFGDPGKLICAEAARLNPVAVVMGSRGLGIVKSVLLGSVSEYCSHHCPCPIVIVPPKDQSVIHA